MYISLVSLARVKLFDCSNFSFNTFNDKLLTPCYTFAATIFFLYSLLLILFFLIFFSLLSPSGITQEAQIMFYGYSTLDVSCRLCGEDSEIFQDERFHLERRRRKELLSILIKLAYVFLLCLLFCFPKRPLQHWYNGQNIRKQIKFRQIYNPSVTAFKCLGECVFLHDRCEILIYSLRGG